MSKVNKNEDKHYKGIFTYCRYYCGEYVPCDPDEFGDYTIFEESFYARDGYEARRAAYHYADAVNASRDWDDYLYYFTGVVYRVG